MKHKKCISHTFLQRDSEILPQLYRRAKTMVPFPTTVAKICAKAAELPVDRFWISDDSAYEYIRQKLSGNDIRFHDPWKQRLYSSLFDVVVSMRKNAYYASKPLREVSSLALLRPAPCVGVNPRTIQRTLHKYLKNQ